MELTCKLFRFSKFLLSVSLVKAVCPAAVLSAASVDRDAERRLSEKWGVHVVLT